MASLDGSAFLKRYQNSASKADRSQVDDSISLSYYDAVADGKHLADVYSAQKRHVLNDSSMMNSSTASNFIFGTPDDRGASTYDIGSPVNGGAPDALELVRGALSKLMMRDNNNNESKDENTGNNDNDKSLDDIVAMLQGVEEQLDAASDDANVSSSDFMAAITSGSKSIRNRLPFSPAVGLGGKENSMPNTPLGTSDFINTNHPQKNLLRVYMDNQLDLNESEMRYYEDVLNELLTKMDAMATKEGEVEQKLLNKLEDALQWKKKYELKAEEMETMEKEVQELRSQLAIAENQIEFQRESLSAENTPVKSSTTNGDADVLSIPSDNDGTDSVPSSRLKLYKENQLDLNASEAQYYEEMTTTVLAKLEEAEAAKVAKDEQISNLQSQLEKLKITAASCMSPSVSPRKRRVSTTISDYAEEVSDLKEELEYFEANEGKLKMRILELESALLKLRGGDEVNMNDVSFSIEEYKEKYTQEMRTSTSLRTMAEQVQQQLQDTQSMIADLTAERDELEEDMQLMTDAAELKDEKIGLLESELVTIQEQLKIMGEDVTANVGELQSKLELLMQEKKDMTDFIEEQKTEIEAKETLLDSKATELQLVLDQVEKESAQKSKLWNELQGVLRQDEQVLQDLNSSQQTASANVSMNISQSQENLEYETKLLAEKLEDAERRAESNASTEVESYVASARENAYLDGEMTRLQTLSENFKEMNTKLIQDIQNAKKDLKKAKNVEAELISVKEELELTKQQLVESNESMQSEMKRRDDAESLLVDQAEQERESLHHQLDVLREDLEKSVKSSQLDCENIQQMEETIKTLTEQKEELLQSNLSMQSEVDDAKISVDGLKIDLSDRTTELDNIKEELMQKEALLISTEQKADNIRIDSQQRINDLESEISQLEGDANKKTRQITELKSKLEEKETVEQKKANKVSEFKKKITELESQIEKQEEKLSVADKELTNRYHTISKLTDDADAWQNSYEKLMNIDHKLVKEQVGHLEIENESLKEEVATHTNDLEYTRGLLSTSETEKQEVMARLTVVEKELTRIQEEDLTSAHEQYVQSQKLYQDMHKEHTSLKDQYDELHILKTSHDQTISTLNEEVESHKRLALDYEKRLENMEIEAHVSRGEIGASKELESQVHLKMREICDSLQSIVSNEAYTRGIVTVEKDSVDVTVDVPMTDLLAALQTRSDSAVAIMEMQNQLIDASQETIESLNDALSAQQVQIQSVNSVRDNLNGNIAQYESQLESTESALEALKQEKEKMLSTTEETSLRTRTVLRDLNNALLDSIHRVTHTPGDEAPKLLEREAAEYVVEGDETKSGDDISATSLLSDMLYKVEKTLHLLTSTIEAKTNKINEDRTALELAESALQEEQEKFESILESSLEADESALNDKVAENEVEKEMKNAEIVQLKHEHAQFKLMLSEVNKQKLSLEAECEASNQINTSLRQSFDDAEKLCNDFKVRNRMLEEQNDRLTTEVHATQSELAVYQQKVNGHSLEIEKAQLEIQRLRGDNQIMLHLQHTLEHELARLGTSIESPKVEDDKRSPSSSNNEDAVPASPAKDKVPSLLHANVSTFDAERLLGALYSAIDQVAMGAAAVVEEFGTVVDEKQNSDKDDKRHATGHVVSEISRRSAHMHQLHDEALSNNTSMSMSTRFENAIKYLSELRLWGREDARMKRQLLRKCGTMEHDLNLVKVSLEEEGKSLQQVKQLKMNRESDVQELQRKVQDSKLAVSRRDDDISRLKREMELMRKRYEEERKLRLNLGGNLQQLEMERNRVKKEDEVQQQGKNKLSSQISSYKDKVSALEGELDEKKREIRVLKAEIELLTSEIDSQAEQKNNKDKLNDSNLEIDSVLDTSHIVRIKELEGALNVSKVQMSHMRQDSGNNQGKVVSLERDVDKLRKKLELAESRYQTTFKEKLSLQVEISNVKASLAEANQTISIESSHRKRAEAQLEVKNTLLEDTSMDGGLETSFSSASKVQIEVNHAQILSLQARADEAERQRKQGEEERVQLRSSISELKASMDSKANTLLEEQLTRKKLAAEVETLTSKVSKYKEELSNHQKIRNNVNEEGKVMRRQVNEAVTRMREVVNIIRAEAAAEGTTLSSPEKDSSNNHSAQLLDMSISMGLGGNGAELQTLSEVIGIRELASALAALKEVIIWLRSAPANRTDRHTKVRKLEHELVVAQNEVMRLKTASEEIKNRAYGELQVTEQRHAVDKRRLLDLESKEASLIHENKTMAAKLDALNRQLSDERTKIKVMKEELSSTHDASRVLREALDEKTQECDVANQSLVDFQLKDNVSRMIRSAGGVGVSSYDITDDTVVDNNDNQAAILKQELRAVQHHRDLLQTTVNRLEQQLKLQSDNIYHTYSSMDTRALENLSGKDLLETFKRQSVRYKAKMECMEELLNNYREAALALYGDGSTYSYIQYELYIKAKHLGATNKSMAANNAKGWYGWNELQMAALRQTYDTEMKLMDSEIIDLRGKLRHSQAYCAELAKRFQENLNEQYSNQMQAGILAMSKERLDQEKAFLEENVRKSNTEVTQLTLVSNTNHMKLTVLIFIDDTPSNFVFLYYLYRLYKRRRTAPVVIIDNSWSLWRGCQQRRKA